MNGHKVIPYYNLRARTTSSLQTNFRQQIFILYLIHILYFLGTSKLHVEPHAT